MTEQNPLRDGWRKKIERYVDRIKSHGLVGQALAMLHRQSVTEQPAVIEAEETPILLNQEDLVTLQHENILVSGQIKPVISDMAINSSYERTNARFFLVPNTNYNQMVAVPTLRQSQLVQITIPGQYVIIGRIEDITVDQLAYFRVVTPRAAQLEKTWSWVDTPLNEDN